MGLALLGVLRGLALGDRLRVVFVGAVLRLEFRVAFNLDIGVGYIITKGTATQPERVRLN